MKRILAYLLFLVSTVYGGPLDSLMERISDKPDTIKIRLLNEACWSSRSSNPQFALECGMKALSIGIEIEDKSLQAVSSNYIGVVYRNLGDYNNSLKYYLSALRLSKEAKDSVQIAYSYNNIGGIYRLTGDYQSALQNILNALGMFDKMNDKRGAAFCTINIAIIYRKQKNYSKSIEYLQKTYAIREELKDEQGLALTMTHLAEVYYEQEDYETAKGYYRNLQKMYEKLGEKKGLAAVLGGLGGVYQSEGDIKRAISYRQKALDLDTEIGNLEGQVINHNNLGILKAYSKNFGEALMHLNTAMSLARSLNSNYALLECYKFLSEYYDLTSDHKTAYKYSQKFIELKDTILAKAQIELTAELEARYNMEQAQKENELLQKDIESGNKQRTYLIIIVILIVFAVIIIYWRYLSKKHANQKLERLNATKDKFFNILAHDLKNPFHSLLGFSEYLTSRYDSITEDEKKTGIKDMYSSSKKLYELVENLLEWSKTQTGSMEYNPIKINVKNIVQKNIFIYEQNAKLKNISMHSEIDDSNEVFADEEMLNTIIRNLINNAIKFTGKGGEIKIESNSEDGFILISFSDTGIGIEKERLESLFTIDKHEKTLGTNNERGSGLGLILVGELIEINKGKISVKSEAGKGTVFTISLPSSA